MHFGAGENPFLILGVDETADEGEIRAAFNELIKQAHPDSSRDSVADPAWEISRLQRARDALLDSDVRESWVNRMREEREAKLDSSRAALVLFAEDTPTPPPQPRAYPFWGWLDLLFFLFILVACLIGAAIAVTGFNFALVVAGLSAYSLSLAQAAVLMQLVGFGPALFILSRMLHARYGQGLRAAIQLMPMQRVALYASTGIVTAILVSVLNYVLKLQDLEMPMNEFIKSDADLILIGIAAFTFGPLFEEMIFRGFLQPLFVKGIGVPGGILATALLFALPHGPQYGWHWQLILIITLAGCVFGTIRWYAASTTAATIAHAAYNGLLLAGAVIQRLKEMS